MEAIVAFIQNADRLELNKQQATLVLIDLLAMRNGAKPKLRHKNKSQTVQEAASDQEAKLLRTAEFEFRYGHEVRRIAKENMILFYGGSEGNRYIKNSLSIEGAYLYRCTSVSVEEIEMNNVPDKHL